MRYQGGKSKIATALAAKIRELCPTTTEIWEPFCGGGAVTLALAKKGFRVHASDKHEDLILMWQALMRGETAPFADVTEAEYQALKTAVPSARRGFVGHAGSFGGAWWGGWARDSTGRRIFIREARENNARLIGHPIIFTFVDYRSISNHVLVYADIPYKGTKPYKGSVPFDHDAFWAWVRNRSGATFVSELQGPEDMQIVWRKDLVSSNSRNSPTSKATASHEPREERLYYKPATIPPHDFADAA